MAPLSAVVLSGYPANDDLNLPLFLRPPPFEQGLRWVPLLCPCRFLGDAGGDEGGPAEGLCREYVKLIDGFFSIPVPFVSLLPFTTYDQALKARKKVASTLRQVIRKKMDEKLQNGNTNGEGEEEKKNMVEELLEAEGGSFSEEEIMDFCLSLLVAGYETTYVLMTLAVKFLTRQLLLCRSSRLGEAMALLAPRKLRQCR